MKKLTGIIILTIISLWACRLEELDECSANTTFERIYTEATDFEARDIAATADGAYVICGNIGGDIFLMKIDEQGKVLFYKQDIIPGTDETCRSIVATADGGFLICGEQESKAYFATYNATGNHLNQSTKNQASTCQCINPTNDGRYVFAGRILNTNGVNNTYVGLINIDNTYPNITDEYIPNPPRDKGEYTFSVIDANDSYAVASRSLNTNSPNNNAAHFFRLRYDMSLIQASEKVYDLSPQTDAAHDIVQASDGDFILTGSMELAGINAFALKVNKNGQNQQLNQYGGQYIDVANAIIKTNDNKYVIAGITGENFGPAAGVIYNVYLVKINEDGSVVWERTFGQSGINEQASAVLQTDCGYIVVGTSINSIGSKPYVIKVDNEGNIL